MHPHPSVWNHAYKARVTTVQGAKSELLGSLFYCLSVMLTLFFQVQYRVYGENLPCDAFSFSLRP